MPIDRQLIDEAFSGQQNIGLIGRPEATIDYDRPKLYPKQEAAIFDPRRMSIIEASTKSGKTAGCVVCRSRRSRGSQVITIGELLRSPAKRTSPSPE
jgi:hypothetical protein